ncbi:MAG: hypothetical protein NTX98_02955 [Candidatus Doudnabacteria bacterium]|nr:hypothetical protein [Candidatus Doudnabacteria bacterium]
MLLLSALLIVVITSAFLGFLLTRVPFVPTRRGDIEFIVKKLGITSRDVFYDLGSGNGKVVFLANQISGAKCVGFELSLWTHLFALIKRKVHPVKSRIAGTAEQLFNGVKSEKHKIEFRNQNFFKHSWSEADYIYCYLYPPLMGRVEEKFLADCKPGSVAIIRDFSFPNLKPIEIYYMPKKHEIYVYKKM